ncbi:hypothetical protein BV25DRAFT_1207817, partial [Artomyces pyxidatus]
EHLFNTLRTPDYSSTLFLDFITAILVEPADHRHLMREARAMDSSGLAAKARAAQVMYDQAVADEKRAKDVVRKRKADEKQDRLDAVILITNLAALDKLTSAQLEDQLDRRRRDGDSSIGLKKDSLRKSEKLSKLHEAISRSASLIDGSTDAMEVD